MLESISHIEMLKHIVFISLPEDLDTDALPFGTETLIPVEMPPGESEWSLDKLSWEMIVSAMLKILAYAPEYKDVPKYKDFIPTVNPDIETEMLNAAIQKAQQKDFSLAEEILLALSNLNPENLGAILNLALIYQSHGEVYEELGKTDLSDEYMEHAFITLKRCLQLSPRSPEVNYETAIFHLRNNNYQKAENHFSVFLETSTDSMKKEDVKKVLAKIRKMSDEDSVYKEAYDNIQMGKEDEGIKKILGYIKSNPDIWNAWFLLGWAYRRKKQYQEALSAFHHCLELYPGNVDALNESAICFIELGNLDSAEEQLKTALETEPENTKLISNMGIVFLKKGEKEEASELFELVLSIDPDDTLAREYLKKSV